MPMMKTAGIVLQDARLALFAREVWIALEDLLGVEERDLLGKVRDSGPSRSCGNRVWTFASAPRRTRQIAWTVYLR